MATPLNASATTAGALMSSSTFEVPPYQREYAWQEDEVADFWTDLSLGLEDDSYFLGLIILTDEGDHRRVVDGQQRILTLTLLATALYYEAVRVGRKALAELIQVTFLRSIDYATDETRPRVYLTDFDDNNTLQQVLSTGEFPGSSPELQQQFEGSEAASWSRRMGDAFLQLRQKLRSDLTADPFKRLGRWAEFLTDRLYLAVFLHPDPGSAYRVFEVINTRGREPTTADLLKTYVLSQTAPQILDDRYSDWMSISHQFAAAGDNAFVQYIRHVVTVESGHVLPKDLYDFLAQRSQSLRRPPSPDELMELLERRLPLYLQMIDPTVEGPAEGEHLKIFDALNSLSVIAVRPLLLAIFDVADSVEGMRAVLRLVVRRIVVGNLGTGNVERRFGEAAKKVHDAGSWESALDDLRDLNPGREEFQSQLRRRSFNKATLTFLRRSIVQQTPTPELVGYLHMIRPRQAPNWAWFEEEEAAYWFSTIGNTYLATLERRPHAASTWVGFQQSLLPYGVEGEWQDELAVISSWDPSEVTEMGLQLAEAGADVWFG